MLFLASALFLEGGVCYNAITKRTHYELTVTKTTKIRPVEKHILKNVDNENALALFLEGGVCYNAPTICICICISLSSSLKSWTQGP